MIHSWNHFTSCWSFFFVSALSFVFNSIFLFASYFPFSISNLFGFLYATLKERDAITNNDCCFSFSCFKGLFRLNFLFYTHMCIKIEHFHFICKQKKVFIFFIIFLEELFTCEVYQIEWWRRENLLIFQLFAFKSVLKKEIKKYNFVMDINSKRPQFSLCSSSFEDKINNFSFSMFTKGNLSDLEVSYIIRIFQTLYVPKIQIKILKDLFKPYQKNFRIYCLFVMETI